ncbi:MAG: radical SAM protein [Pirellulaceae bacterium]|nr:radical SAM protein [Pirellulaceae bacterium]
MSDGTIYGFQAHLSPEFPSQVIIDVTEHCNLACVHCPHPEYAKTNKWTGCHLTLAIHNRAIDEIATAGKGICQYVRYTANGEPLINPSFLDMVKYAGQRLDHCSINVTTNAKSLNERRALALLNAGVNVIDISLDAFKPETYARIRKKGDLHKTKQNVLQLLDLIQQGDFETKLVVSFVRQPLNEGEADDFEKYWKHQGVHFVVIRRLHSAGGAKTEHVKPETERYPCLYPWERITLAPDGALHFCPQDWEHGSEICSLAGTSLQEVWQGDVMQALRKAHLDSDFSCHRFCGKCPDWSTTRWPCQGRSYSNLMRELVPADLLAEGAFA